MITSTNPYTGEEFASVNEYSPAQIDKTLETAHLGFES